MKRILILWVLGGLCCLTQAKTVEKWTLVTDNKGLEQGVYAIVSLNSYKAIANVRNEVCADLTSTGFVFDADGCADSAPEGTLEFTLIPKSGSNQEYAFRFGESSYLAARTDGSYRYLIVNEWLTGSYWYFTGTYWKYKNESTLILLANQQETLCEVSSSASNKWNIGLVKKTIEEVEEEEVTYTRTLTSSNMGTICVPKNVIAGNAQGATFYKVVAKNLDGTQITMEEVTDLQGGKPYIYVPNQGESQLTLTGIGDDYPASNENGLYGTLANISFAELQGSYLLSQNEFWPVIEGCTLAANKAYLVLDEVPLDGVIAPVPGRKRLSVGKATNGIGTPLQEMNSDKPCMKFLHGNKMVIIRNHQQYSILGNVL